MNRIVNKSIEEITDVELASAMRAVWFYLDSIDDLSWFHDSYQDHDISHLEMIVNNEKLKAMADDTLNKFDSLEFQFKQFRKEYKKLLRKKSRKKNG